MAGFESDQGRRGERRVSYQDQDSLLHRLWWPGLCTSCFNRENPLSSMVTGLVNVLLQRKTCVTLGIGLILWNTYISETEESVQTRDWRRWAIKCMLGYWSSNPWNLFILKETLPILPFQTWRMVAMENKLVALHVWKQVQRRIPVLFFKSLDLIHKISYF